MSETSSSIINLSPDKFEEALAEHDVLVINFGARWCGPCRVFRTVFTDAAGVHRDVSFAVVDVEEQPDLSTAFDVKLIPKLAVMRGGALVFSHEGSLTGQALDDVISKVRELDVEAVRQAAAAAGQE